jgi:hypothetical protein
MLTHRDRLAPFAARAIPLALALLALPALRAEAQSATAPGGAAATASPAVPAAPSLEVVQEPSAEPGVAPDAARAASARDGSDAAGSESASDPSTPASSIAPAAIADELAALRLAARSDRADAGVVLLAVGLASVLGGAITAAAGYEDPFWLSFGASTAGWGAINAALSATLFDLDGGLARGIEGDRALRGEALARARELELRREHDAAAIYALNLGLDIFYVATAGLMYGLGEGVESADDRGFLQGYAMGQLSQGTFLLVFDLIEWIASAERANRVGRLPMVRF